jgi:hypothetical protein
VRAIGRPHCKKAMIGVLKGAAATHGNKPGVPDLGEDDLSAYSSSFCPSLVTRRIHVASHSSLAMVGKSPHAGKQALGQAALNQLQALRVRMVVAVATIAGW